MTHLKVPLALRLSLTAVVHTVPITVDRSRAVRRELSTPSCLTMSQNRPVLWARLLLIGLKTRSTVGCLAGSLCGTCLYCLSLENGKLLL